MKKTILAIAVVLMMAAAGIAAAEEAGVDVGGTVANVPPIVNEIMHDAEVLSDGTVPIHSNGGATFTVTAFVTDDNGVDTLTDVYCVVTDSDGVSVSEGSMAKDSGDAVSVKMLFDATVLATSPAGEYTITVTATDDGQLSHVSSITETFTVTGIEKFTIDPLRLNLRSGTTVPGSLFTVTMNYGERGEVFTVDSVTFTDLTITGPTIEDIIPSGNIHPLGLPMLTGVGVGESTIVELEVDVPQATTNGDITGGAGTLIISTYPPAI